MNVGALGDVTMRGVSRGPSIHSRRRDEGEDIRDKGVTPPLAGPFGTISIIDEHKDITELHICTWIGMGFDASLIFKAQDKGGRHIVTEIKCIWEECKIVIEEQKRTALGSIEG